MMQSLYIVYGPVEREKKALNPRACEHVLRHRFVDCGGGVLVMIIERLSGVRR